MGEQKKLPPARPVLDVILAICENEEEARILASSAADDLTVLGVTDLYSLDVRRYPCRELWKVVLESREIAS